MKNKLCLTKKGNDELIGWQTDLNGLNGYGQILSYDLIEFIMTKTLFFKEAMCPL